MCTSIIVETYNRVSVNYRIKIYRISVFPKKWESVQLYYELVPEAYRQRFQDAKCQDSQTYMDFAREKETLFNKWCASQQVGNNFDKLKQLILLEEFKKCVSTPIKTYLEE